MASRERSWVLFGVVAAGMLVLTRSPSVIPIVLAGTVAAIDRKRVYAVAVISAAVLIGGLAIAFVAVPARIERVFEGSDGSFSERIVYPIEFAKRALLKSPVFGLGIIGDPIAERNSSTVRGLGREALLAAMPNSEANLAVDRIVPQYELAL